jgi:hypothetical protein
MQMIIPPSPPVANAKAGKPTPPGAAEEAPVFAGLMAAKDELTVLAHTAGETSGQALMALSTGVQATKAGEAKLSLQTATITQGVEAGNGSARVLGLGQAESADGTAPGKTTQVAGTPEGPDTHAMKDPYKEQSFPLPNRVKNHVPIGEAAAEKDAQPATQKAASGTLQEQPGPARPEAVLPSAKLANAGMLSSEPPVGRGEPMSAQGTAPGTQAVQTNSAARPDNAPAPASSAPADQLRAAVAQRGEGRMIEVQLDPPELGRVQMEFEVARSGSVKAVVLVADPETLDLLRKSASQLTEDLQSEGFGDVELEWRQAQGETDRNGQAVFQEFQLASPAAAPGPLGPVMSVHDGQLDVTF